MESGWDPQRAARRRIDSFLTEGLDWSEEEESKRELRSMGTASFWRVWMMVSSSSMAIWWVSLSESFERELRIRCFNSTIAKCEDKDDDDDNGGGGAEDCDVDADVVGGAVDFVDLEDLGP